MTERNREKGAGAVGRHERPRYPGVRFALFPREVMNRADRNGHNSKDLSVALIEEQRVRGQTQGCRPRKAAGGARGIGFAKVRRSGTDLQ